MADKPEKSGQEPNLELPSLLSFGRNRKKRKGISTEVEADVAPTTAADPAAASTEALEPLTGLAPSTDKAKRPPPVPPPTARTDAPTQQIPVPPAPPPQRDEPPEVEEPPVVASRDAVEEPQEHPGPSFIEPEPVRTHAHPEKPAAVPVDESLGRTVDEPVEEPGAQRPARVGTPLSLPTMDPRVACVVTGVVVGVLGVLLAYFASRGCETVRGVGSCGGLGLLALLAIVVIQVVLGSILLKAWQISDTTSTSFLAVGLVAVFVLLFLLSSLDSIWMLVVIPVLSGLSFLLSWWVTTTFVEVPGEDARR